MSTAAESSSVYADCDEYIEYQLKVARGRIKWTDLLTAAVLAAVLLIGYVLVFTVLDHWVISGGFTPWTRAAMLIVVLSVCGGIVYRYVIRPWSREIHPLYAAKMLDGTGSDMEGSLMSLVDLNSAGAAASEEIRRTMEKRAAVRLSEVNMDEAIDRRWLMKLGFLLFGLVLGTCLYAVFSPKSMSLLRPLTTQETAVATSTRILKVHPGHDSIAAGEELEVLADIGGHIPEDVLVLFSTIDNTYVDEPLTMQPTEDEGRFRVQIVGEADRGLRQSFTYSVVAGDAVSEDYQVTVNQPPSANVTQLEYHYPPYMVLEDYQTQNGNIIVWEGTEVVLQAEASVPLQSAILKFSDTASFATKAEEVPLSVDGTAVSGKFTLDLREDRSSPKFCRIEVEDLQGREDPSPTVYAVNIRPDRAPVVRLLDPIRDLRVPANQIIPLLAQAEDPDFLLRSVKLHYDINGEPRTPEFLYDATRSGLRQGWSGGYEFQLGNMELNEGDVVSYYVTATDNKHPLGSSSRSGTLKFQIELPTTPEKVQERLQRDRELQEQQFRQSEKQADPVEERTDPEKPQEAANDAGDPGAGEEGQPNDDKTQQNDSTGRPDDGQTDDAAGQQTSGENSTDGTGDSDKKDPSQESTTSDGDETGSDQSNTGKPNGGNGATRKKEVADNEAMQQLLDRYRQQESGDGEESSTDSVDGPNNEDSLKPEGPETPDGGLNAEPQTKSSGDGDPPTAGETSSSDDPEDAGSSPTADGEKPTDPANPQDGSAQPDTPSKDGDPAANSEGTSESTADPDSRAPKNEGETESATPSDDGGANPGEPSAPPTEMTDDQQDDDKQGAGQKDGDEQGDDKQGAGQKDGDEQGDDKQGAGQKDGDEQGDDKQGGGQKDADEQGDDKQGGGQKDADEQGDDKQGGGQKDGGQQGDNKQGGGQKDGDKQGGGEKGGGEKGGGEKGGGEKGGGEKGGGEKGGGEKGGGEKGGGEKGGGEKGGGEKGGGEKGGGEKGGGEKGGGEKDGGEKDGGEKGGGEKGGGEKDGGEKDGGEKDGGEKGGGEKGGGEKGGGEKGGGKKAGGKKGSGGQGGSQEGPGSESGSGKGGGGEAGSNGTQGGKGPGTGQGRIGNGGTVQKGGDAKGGSNKGTGGNSATEKSDGGAQGRHPDENSDTERPKGDVQNGAGGNGGPQDAPAAKGDGAGGSGSGEFKADDPNVKSAAQAADLVLKRLKKDLDRGKVDQDLLDELGWSEDQLKSFSKRMQQQLDALKDDPDTAAADRLQRRRVEDLLKSLDIETGAQDRVGQKERDREQQDTTSRRSTPPSEYKDWAQFFQRALSEGARRSKP